MQDSRPAALGLAMALLMAASQRSVQMGTMTCSWIPVRPCGSGAAASGPSADARAGLLSATAVGKVRNTLVKAGGPWHVRTAAASASAVVAAAAVAVALRATRSAMRGARVRLSRHLRRYSGVQCSLQAQLHQRRMNGTTRTQLFSAATTEVKGASIEGAVVSELSLSQKVELVRSVGEECQTEPELRKLIEKKPDFVLYDGFEPSGRMHIAQGIYKTINVNKCTQSGGTFIFWVADWFALMNDKMGGDIDKIKTVGKYLIEVWKASGMDMSRVKFLWSSEEIAKNAEEYWGHALDIARRTTLARVKKCCQIMGRQEDALTAAQILYPIMQCADIFFLKADICQLGVDQRKVNMLARDYCESAGRKLKPVILSHHMLYGLKKGQAKMSKSDPDSAIFMEDSPEDVERKIQNAYCPAAPEVASSTDDGEMHLVEDELKNPCLDYAKYILFSKEQCVVEVGGQSFSSFEDLRRSFMAGEIGEAELKRSLISEVNTLLEPVRHHFARSEEARELLEKVREWRKENLVPTSSLTRLKLTFADGGPLFVVFAPLPSGYVRLGDVWSVLNRLRHAPEGCMPVLWLRDWSARTLERAGGSVDCVRGFYELFLHGLRTLAPDLMEGVQVLWQGETILSGPSEYWTSVINAGRQCSLEMVRNALPASEDLDGSAQVLACIMHIGDVLALAAREEPTTLCCEPVEEGLQQLAMQHLDRCGLPVPELQVLSTPALRLRGEGEGLELDTNVMLTDMQPDINKKIKKAFCEPENVEFCPPLSWVDSVLLPLQGEFVISRKPENGGDKAYTTPEALREDFATGVLHPGDLKPAVGRALNAALEGIRSGLKASSTLKNAQKKLQAYLKAQQKLKSN